MTENDEPCMCGTPFTCLADVHDREVAMISHPSHPDQLMASALGVCWHSPTSDRWPCTARPAVEPVASCATSVQWLDDSPVTPCVLPKGHDGSHRYEELCGLAKPGGATTCIEPAGHAGPDGRGQLHGDGSVIRWIYR